MKSTTRRSELALLRDRVALLELEKEALKEGLWGIRKALDPVYGGERVNRAWRAAGALLEALEGPCAS